MNIILICFPFLSMICVFVGVFCLVKVWRGQFDDDGERSSGLKNALLVSAAIQILCFILIIILLIRAYNTDLEEAKQDDGVRLEKVQTEGMYAMFAICFQNLCNMFAILVSQRQESEESRSARRNIM